MILDPHPVHRAHIFQEFLNRHQIRYIYLPPYSPELSPIEEAWSKFKNFLKRQKARTVDCLVDALKAAAKTITSSDAQGYFQHVEDLSKVTI